MPNLRCPRCRTITSFDAGHDPVCPRCGYGSESSEPEPVDEARPTPGVSAGSASAASAASPSPSRAPTSPARPATPAYGHGPRTDGGAVAALVLGVAGLVFFPLIPSIVAWILGAQAVRRCDEDPELEGRAMAMVGMVLGIVGVALVAIVLFILFVFFSAIAAAW